MDMLDLQEIILTRTVTRATVRYEIDIKAKGPLGDEKVFHYKDLNHPDLKDMQYFINLNVRRAESEHARRLIFSVSAPDVIVEK